MSAGADIRTPPGPFLATDARTRLLAGAVVAIDDHGYRAAGTEQIAAAADLPVSIFDRYFADKGACATAAYERAVGWLEGQIPSAFGLADNWSQGVRALVARALDLLAPHPELARFGAWDFPRSDRVAHARHQVTVARLAVALRAGRGECPWGAELPVGSEEIAIGGALWMLGHRVRSDEGDLRRLAPDVTYFLLVPYLGVAGAQLVSRGDGSLRATGAP